MSIHQEWILAEPVDHADSVPVRSAVVRSILARRGVRDADAFRLFTSPTVEDLHDGSLIDGMDVACKRIELAISDSEAILIYGDYDVDGVTSIVLLKTVLKKLGAKVGFVVPHRIYDGYGLRTEVIERVLAEKQVGLIITVDCGITSVEPVRLAIEKGIDVIITDHHLPPDDLPLAAAVLNPKKEGCVYPFDDLAGVGVAFKLCAELIRRAGSSLSLESLIKIAAIGTIADVAPLIDENRTIARLGLLGLADSSNPGLRALLKVLGLHGTPLLAEDVGFKIGPRINAAGRIASADTAIELFDAADESTAYDIAFELNRLNQKRKSIETTVLTDAREMITDGHLPNVLFLRKEGWHKGVLGLCAGRIAEQFHRPTLLATIENGLCTGSARSIAAIDLHARLDRLNRYFLSFGGHEFACGFSLKVADVLDFARDLPDVFGEIPERSFVRTLRVEEEVTFDQITPDLVDELGLLEPLGQGNPEPRFLLRDVAIRGIREFSEGCYSVTLEGSTGGAEAILWPSVGGLLSVLNETVRVDLVVSIGRDRFTRDKARLTIIDAAGSDQSPVRNESTSPSVLDG